MTTIGAVSYLNTKPLITHLANKLHAPDKLFLDLPSRLANQLANGQHDIGLIPVVEFFRGPNFRDDGTTDISSNPYRIVSDACIACHGPVRSVRLFFRVPPESVRTIAVDEGSRTSVALTRVLLDRRFQIAPELTILPIQQNPESVAGDAVLVIGDRAMHPDRYQGFIEDWDLGDEWLAETGLPFVFAAWIARSSSVDLRWGAILSKARDDGLSDLQSISERYASDYDLLSSECLDYLSRNLRFHLNDPALNGLRLFHRECSRLGLIGDTSESLEQLLGNVTQTIPPFPNLTSSLNRVITQ